MAARKVAEFSPAHDPMQEAVNQDRESVADALLDVLETLSGVDQGSIRGILYRIPVPNGKYEWIRDVYPPFDLSEIMRSLKEEIGGGDFALRIMAEGKPRKTIHFSIMKDKIPLIAPANNNGGDKSDVMAMMSMMMQMQMESAREARASADRQMTALVGAATVLAPLLLGGKDKTSEVMAALGPYINRQPEDGTEKTLALLKNAKDLFGDSGGKSGDDMQDAISSGVKLIGPVFKGLGDMVSRGRGNAPQGGYTGAVADGSGDGGAPPNLMLGAPAQGTLPAPTSPEQGLAFQKGGTGAYPILDLVRDDVLFFYRRNHDAEKAADMVYDTFEAHEVSEDDINALYLAAMSSPDWLEFFAAEGIDLRARPQWAEQFLTALGSIHTENSASLTSGGGEGGSETDAGGDGELSEGGD